MVTTAPTWEQVNAILWKELRRAKAAADMSGEINRNAHYHIGEELVAVGRKPADHNVVAFQGIHERYLLAIIDEASGIPEELWDAVGSLITNENSCVLAIGNPDDPTSHFEKVCRPGSGWNVIAISALDTPAFTGEKVPAAMLELLVSELWVEEKQREWGEDSPRYVSKVLGEFPNVSDSTLISPGLIMDAIIKQNEAKTHPRYAVDVARFGSDETVMYRYQDGIVRLCWAEQGKSTMETVGLIVKEVKRLPGRVTIDEVGIGAGVLDRVREIGLPCRGFNGGESPKDKERFG